MEWMNYHHLLYFWTVVREGSISKASEQLRVSSPAISAQLRSLEENFGEKLLRRSGRNLVMTEMGRTVFSYAEDIFSLGRELMDTVRNRPTGRPMRLDIGVVDVLPKLIAQWLIEPALHLKEPIRIVCREATSDQLISRLATLEFDVVLSDAPINPNLKVRAYNHLLGESGVTFVAMSKLAGKVQGSISSAAWIARPCYCPRTTWTYEEVWTNGLRPMGIRPGYRRRVRRLCVA